MVCIPASEVNVIDSNTLTFYMPPHVAGVVCVTVTVGGVAVPLTPGGGATGETKGDAEARGWGTGWPDCHPELMTTVGGALNLPVRNEIAPLITYLLNETETRGYHLKPGECWGFACRQIRATGIASNHSWGLAVDLNAPENPATFGGVVITDMPSWMVPLWNSFGFRNGAQYSGNFKDAMHMEFMGTPADAASQIAGLP